nr:hypothetical protein GCM10020063_060900 [Dactylosporangium thailandense]
MAADGTHVAASPRHRPQQWFTSRDGAAYRAGRPDGLGENLNATGEHPPVVARPGFYLAFDDEAMYRSADGLHWTRIPIKAP